MDLSLAPIATRIRTQVGALKAVGEAADLAAALEDLKIAPAAFVIPLRSQGGGNALDSADAAMQRLSITFGVVFGIQNLRDATGAKASADLATLRGSVFEALLGWRPTADHDICLIGAGQLAAMRDRVLWWQDSFTTAIYVRKV